MAIITNRWDLIERKPTQGLLNDVRRGQSRTRRELANVRQRRESDTDFWTDAMRSPKVSGYHGEEDIYPATYDPARVLSWEDFCDQYEDDQPLWNKMEQIASSMGYGSLEDVFNKSKSQDRYKDILSSIKANAEIQLERHAGQEQWDDGEAVDPMVRASEPYFMVSDTERLARHRVMKLNEQSDMYTATTDDDDELIGLAEDMARHAGLQLAECDLPQREHFLLAAAHQIGL